MRATDVNHMCDFKFPTNHMKIKSKKRQVRLVLIIYLTQHIQNVYISLYNRYYKIINDIFCILFFTFQFGLATLQVLNSYMYLVATVLHRAGLRLILPPFLPHPYCLKAVCEF